MRVRLVAEDPLARGGLRAALSGRDELELDDEGPEVVLWDPTDDDAEPPSEDEAPVVALVRDEAQAQALMRRGCEGILLRDGDPARMSAALAAAAAGLRVLDDAFSETLWPRPYADEDIDALTPREQEVLELVAEGRSNREIGVALGISENTSKFHVNAILDKLDASSRTDAVVRALRLGLLKL